MPLAAVADLVPAAGLYARRLCRKFRAFSPSFEPDDAAQVAALAVVEFAAGGPYCDDAGAFTAVGKAVARAARAESLHPGVGVATVAAVEYAAAHDDADAVALHDELSRCAGERAQRARHKAADALNSLTDDEFAAVALDLKGDGEGFDARAKMNLRRAHKRLRRHYPDEPAYNRKKRARAPAPAPEPAPEPVNPALACACRCHRWFGRARCLPCCAQFWYATLVPEAAT